MKNKILASIALGALLVSSCKTDDTAQTLDSSNAKVITYDTQATSVNDNLDHISDLVSESYASSSRTANPNLRTVSNRFLTRFPCASVVVEPITNGKKVTITFPDTGCVGPYGNVHKGVLMVTFTGGILNGGTITKTVSFNNYYFNGRKIEGTGVDGVGVVGTYTYPSGGNPTYHRMAYLKITREDAVVIYRNSDFTATKTEGLGNEDWTDNVYSITGTSTNNASNNVKWDMIITSPIIEKTNCEYLIVQGKQQINRNGTIFFVDYGSGACDNKAMVTNESGSATVEIVFGR